MAGRPCAPTTMPTWSCMRTSLHIHSKGGERQRRHGGAPLRVHHDAHLVLHAAKQACRRSALSMPIDIPSCMPSNCHPVAHPQHTKLLEHASVTATES